MKPLGKFGVLKAFYEQSHKMVAMMDMANHKTSEGKQNSRRESRSVLGNIDCDSRKGLCQKP